MNKHHFRIKLTTYLATIAMTVVGLSIIKPQTIFASASPPANLAKETKIATRDIQTVPWALLMIVLILIILGNCHLAMIRLVKH